MFSYNDLIEAVEEACHHYRFKVDLSDSLNEDIKVLDTPRVYTEAPDEWNLRLKILEVPAIKELNNMDSLLSEIRDELNCYYCNNHISFKGFESESRSLTAVGNERFPHSGPMSDVFVFTKTLSRRIFQSGSGYRVKFDSVTGKSLINVFEEKENFIQNGILFKTELYVKEKGLTYSEVIYSKLYNFSDLQSCVMDLQSCILDCEKLLAFNAEHVAYQSRVGWRNEK